ncbi:hypothetical protein G9A89_020958 [Geosiphon pyriformis]|nr:hypothetical protein G9A89_020958 [Geosiphon pyriformis]
MHLAPKSNLGFRFTNAKSTNLKSSEAKMPEIHILHFNDVYHLQAQKHEPVGGAARFATAVQNFRKQYEVDTSCVLFSGDAFNPSIESSISKGQHMFYRKIPALNELGIDVASFGNHDFDFGLPTLTTLIHQTKFPWLLSNVVDSETDDPLAGGKKWFILEKSGLRIGVLGLVEKEWLETIPSLPPTLKYIDFVTVGKQLSTMLRDPNGPYAVDLVIALTHSRLPNDIILAKKCKDDIDLILGGHDHFYYIGKGCQVVEGWTRDEIDGSEDDDGVRVVKSGTDFRELSLLDIHVDVVSRDGDGGKNKTIKSILVTRKEINSAILKDSNMSEIIVKATSEISDRMSRPITYTTTPWDCRSTIVRTQESAFGNFIADLMLCAYAPCINHNIDCSLMCGGTIRSDTIYPPGEITMGDLLEIFPFEDTIVVIMITGQQLWDALENGVSMVPKQEGRFPIFSGLKIAYNPEAEPGKRLRNVWQTETRLPRHKNLPEMDEYLAAEESENDSKLNIIGELDMKKIYTVSTRAYMAAGYDGFRSLALPTTKYLIDDENGIILSTLVHRYFIGLYYVNAMRFNKSCEERSREAVLKAASTWKKFTKKTASHRNISDALHMSMGEEISLVSESESTKARSEFMKDWVTVAPVIEGRIVLVDD